jgi:hypothetical protein
VKDRRTDDGLANCCGRPPTAADRDQGPAGTRQPLSQHSRCIVDDDDGAPRWMADGIRHQCRHWLVAGVARDQIRSVIISQSETRTAIATTATATGSVTIIIKQLS